MKSRPWKVVGAIAVVGALAALLGFTVHLMRLSSKAERELDALRTEVARQRDESAARQSELAAPIAARVDNLSESLKEQAAALADIAELSTRVSKIESERVPAAPAAELEVAAEAPEPARTQTASSTAAPAVKEAEDER